MVHFIYTHVHVPINKYWTQQALSLLEYDKNTESDEEKFYYAVGALGTGPQVDLSKLNTDSCVSPLV